MQRAERTIRQPAEEKPAEGLRLALFSGNYNYTRDGSNQALNRLSSYLIEAGATVRVYSPTTDTPAFEPAGELVSAPSVAIPGRSEYRLALGLTAGLKADLAAFQPTMVHLSAPDLLGAQAGRWGRQAGLPVVASLHTRFETYLSYYGFDWLRPTVERYLDRFYRGCDRVLAPNAPIADLLRAQGLGERVRVWGRGVDRDRFSPERKDMAWRRSLGIADNEIVVAFLGRLVMEKGLDVMADTLARLGDQPIRPLIIGDGPARAFLEARAPEAIFAGHLDGDDLGRAVSSADILFNPSLTEAFGNASLEGMAAGLAVLCPRAPSTSALITDGHDGVLAPSPDAETYANAIRSLIAEPLRRLRLSRAARVSSAAYDWRAICADVLDVYRELGAAPASRARSAA
ncbi:glycosyltransferase family 1 protein [Caulobacter segnis]|uniref:Glycosyl transferase group 1 n=2 Tax=Caulobacter segnis TaxID=88688 RepID=D5VL04_CAUST|nr:glycosyltransferase family 1 protein [Caulobacter segnis]ADG11177.1 glycosyl transferase group 1 [Caulobacter segnis ATCC 21756]AVQ02862.1 glycosyltransferase family 1 protein [Caulobacter segnis]